MLEVEAPDGWTHKEVKGAYCMVMVFTILGLLTGKTAFAFVFGHAWAYLWVRWERLSEND